MGGEKAAGKSDKSTVKMAKPLHLYKKYVYYLVERACWKIPLYGFFHIPNKELNE